MVSFLSSYSPSILNVELQFDTNGNTGGCQATYTVIPNTTVTTPTCANVTLPNLLSIDAQVDNGPMSQVGWINQVSLICSIVGDLSLIF